MKHLERNQVETNLRYDLLSQQEILNRLKNADIDITTQSLRNWELRNLITPAYRTGIKKYRGLRVLYNEFSLAESLAVYYMNTTRHFDDEVMSKIPKYSLSQIEIARQQFCKEHYTIAGYPEPDAITYDIIYESQNTEQYLPTEVALTENNTWDMKTEINGTLYDVMAKSNYDALFITWMFFLQKGCDTFFPEKHI